jgi:RNA polymerase sigma factor for flagellar operon FliA
MKREAASSGLDIVVRPNRVEASLWRRFRFEAEHGCRETLFDRYIGLARSIAAKHHRRRNANPIERGDFEQFAYEGLLQAIDRYDPLRGAPFSAYASRRISGSISDGMARMTEVGAQIRHRHRLEQERLRSVGAEGGPAQAGDAIAALSDAAIGLAIGMMLEGAALARRANAADPGPSAYESLEWREMQARLLEEISCLSEREAAIIRQHYDTGLSFAQIAGLLGLSRGRVSQIHRAALEKLRKRVGAFA